MVAPWRLGYTSVPFLMVPSRESRSAGPAGRSPPPTSALRTVWRAGTRRSAIQQIEEAVPVGHRDPRRRAAVNRAIDKHRNLVGIPVMDIMRRELEVPAQLATVDVERDQGARIKVVAFTGFAVPVGRGIPRSPVDESQRGIVRTGQPVAPPPVFQLSPGQVSPPASPGAGIVQKRQMRLPVPASYASRNPRMPASPPLIPTSTLSSTTSGAAVMEWPDALSPTGTIHRSVPLRASAPRDSRRACRHTPCR